MCSNFQAITFDHAEWVERNFDCELPSGQWREEIYPTYEAPFVWLDEGKPRCDLAQFGLVPYWAAANKKFGLKTYNARSETVAEKPSYRNAWKHKHFGLALMQGFYEPCYESGKAVRWRIKRADSEPIAVASIWERYVDKETGEIRFSFSMLTVNAGDHAVMQHFHRPDDEKRSIVVLQNADYQAWLQADARKARDLLAVTPPDFLTAEAAARGVSATN
jgi:putative SOS response-associated peptidase YedK